MALMMAQRWTRMTNVEHLLSVCVRSGSTHAKRIPRPIRNDMKTINRAWSVHPAVFQKLRKDVLVQPKFKDQIVASDLLDLSNKRDATDNFPDKEIADIHQVQALLRRLPSTPRNVRITKAQVLEKSCCLLVQQMVIKQMLFAMDAFYMAEYRSPMYYNAVFQTIDMKIDDLTIEGKDFTQLLFYASLYRKCPITLLRQLEVRLQNSIESLTGNELGLICHGFFTCNTSFVNYDLIEKTSERLLSELHNETLAPYMVSNYVKALRHAGFSSANFHQKLGDVLSSSHTSVFLSSHLELFRLHYSIGFIHENFCKNLLACVSQRLHRDRSSMRFKDLVALIWGSETLNVYCPNVVSQALLDLYEEEYEQLALQYPEKYLEGLVSLALSGKYPKKAVSYAMSSKFLNLLKERQLEQDFQMLLIHEAVPLMCPDYDGNQLSEDYIAALPDSAFGDATKQLELRQGLSTMMAILQQELGGCQYVKCHHTFKFSKVPDLEIHLTNQGKPVALVDDTESASLTPATRHTAKGPPSFTETITEGRGILGLNRESPEIMHLLPTRNQNADIRKLIIKVLGWNQYALNRPVLLGLHRYELSLLQAKGYEIITVSPVHSSQLETMTAEKQQQFVKTRILGKFLQS